MTQHWNFFSIPITASCRMLRVNNRQCPLLNNIVKFQEPSKANISSTFWFLDYVKHKQNDYELRSFDEEQIRVVSSLTGAENLHRRINENRKLTSIREFNCMCVRIRKRLGGS